MKKSFWLLFALWLLLAAAPAPATTNADQGKQAYLAGKLDKAIDLLEKALLNNESPLQVHMYLTNAYILKAENCIRKENFEAAVDLLHKASQLSPDKPEVQFFLDKARNSIKARDLLQSGDHSLKNGQLEKALGDWRAALKLRSKYPAAEDRLARTKKQADTLSQKYYKSGLDHFAGGQYELAIQDWRRVLLLDPEHRTAKKDIEKAQSELKGFKERGL